MRTLFRTKHENAEAFLRIVDETNTCGTYRPERFIKAMKENQGVINQFCPYGVPDDGLERKNLVFAKVLMKLIVE